MTWLIGGGFAVMEIQATLCLWLGHPQPRVGRKWRRRQKDQSLGLLKQLQVNRIELKSFVSQNSWVWKATD